MSPSPTSPSFGGESNRQVERVREYYGFVLYLVSWGSLTLYFLWALLPDRVLGSLGITYYPSRTWALILPIWILGLIPFIVLFFIGMNLYKNPGINSIYVITDEDAILMSRVDKHRFLHSDLIPDLEDIPLHTVSQLLYAKDRPTSPWRQSGPGFLISSVPEEN